MIRGLKIGQQQAKRLAQKPKTDEAKEEKPAATEKSEDNNEVLNLLKSMQDEIKSLKADKVTSSRESQVMDLIKESSSKERILRDYKRMNLDDDGFNSYLNDLKADLKAEATREAGSKLDAYGKPAGGQANSKKEVTDADIDSLIDKM